MEFYEKVYDESSPSELQKLQSLIPKYFGYTQIMESKYKICMENLCFDMQNPSLMDIKLGHSTCEAEANEQKKKLLSDRDQQTTSAKFGFRVSGISKKDLEGNVIEE